MTKLKGCGSHSCAVIAPVGIGNNGPCRCMVSDHRGQSLVRSLKAEVEELRASRDWPQLIDTLAAQEATITELTADLRDANTRTKTILACARRRKAKVESLQAKVEELTNMVESLCDLIRSQSSRRVSDDNSNVG